MGNYPLEQITKCCGEFSIIVKFIQSPSDVLGIFSLSLKPCSNPNTNYWGKSLACIKRQLVSDCHTLTSVLTNSYSTAIRQTGKLLHNMLQKTSKHDYRRTKVSVWNLKFKIIYIWNRRPGVQPEMCQYKGFQNGFSPFWRWRVAANLASRSAFLKVQHCYKLPFWSKCISIWNNWKGWH